MRPATKCVPHWPPLTGNEQWGYVLESQRLVGYIPLPLPLTSLVPTPGAMANATRVRRMFNYTGLRAQCNSHCVVYQLFGQGVAPLRNRFAGERVFPLEPERVRYLPSSVFARARLIFAPITTGSLTLLLMIFNLVTQLPLGSRPG